VRGQTLPGNSSSLAEDARSAWLGLGGGARGSDSGFGGRVSGSAVVLGGVALGVGFGCRLGSWSRAVGPGLRARVSALGSRSRLSLFVVGSGCGPRLSRSGSGAWGFAPGVARRLTARSQFALQAATDLVEGVTRLARAVYSFSPKADLFPRPSLSHSWICSGDEIGQAKWLGGLMSERVASRG
jgi:hypothetical protein